MSINFSGVRAIEKNGGSITREEYSHVNTLSYESKFMVRLDNNHSTTTTIPTTTTTTMLCEGKKDIYAET